MPPSNHRTLEESNPVYPESESESVISRTEEAAKKGTKKENDNEWKWKDSIRDSIVTRCREYRFDVGC